MKNYSTNSYRQQTYEKLLAHQQTLAHVVRTCHHLMKKAKCHRHFFGNNTWWHAFWGTSDLLPTCQYLALYAIELNQNFTNHKSKILSTKEIEKIILLIEKRIHEKIPVEYITNECQYLGHSFFVNENVLVPRSLMNTRFQDFLKQTQWSNHRVLDLCTGSGCIGVSLALLNPNIIVDCADISPAALDVTNINIKRFDLTQRVQTIQSNLFDNIHHQYDLIISNPPYVSTKEYQAGPMEMKNEPKIALECEDHGLAIVEKMIQDAPQYLNQKGRMIVEVGMPAAKRLKKRYPRQFRWYHPKPAPGQADFLDWITWGRDCIFEMKNHSL